MSNNFASVDSDKLNTALTATADAIREISGDSNDILWNLDTGFAKAIESLPDDIDRKFIENTLTYFKDTKGAYSTIRDFAFFERTSLTGVDFPACKTIGHDAFENCYLLSSINFPLCETIGSAAFGTCRTLKNVHFPSCECINEYAFTACRNLSSAIFPVCISVGSNAFAHCVCLKDISLPACSIINAGAFDGCTNLTSVYLLGSVFVTLLSSDIFSYTPIQNSTYTGKFGSVYVPSSMLASYKTRLYFYELSDRLVGV